MNIGYFKIPDLKDLSKAYDELQHESSKVTLENLALYCQWTRFDSRLGEIIVRFLSNGWKEINPLQFRDALLKQPWPNTAAVLLEFGQYTLQNTLQRKTENESESLFKAWKNLVLSGIEKAHWEQYYIAQRKIGGRAMFDDVYFSLDEYLRWGYFSREILVNSKKISSEQVKTYSLRPETRRRIIKALLESNSRLTTQMYWQAVGKTISKRQAERDLRSQPNLQPVGNTKARVFVSKKKQ